MELANNRCWKLFLEWILDECSRQCALGIWELFATALAQSRQKCFKNANLIMSLFCLNPREGSVLRLGHSLDTRSTVFYCPVAQFLFSRLVSPRLPLSPLNATCLRHLLTPPAGVLGAPSIWDSLPLTLVICSFLHLPLSPFFFSRVLVQITCP